MTQICFDVTAHESSTIYKLVKRARALEISHGGKARSKIEWLMDFKACHANGTPLRLDALLEADDFNFMHDALGICRHLNRETGKLENNFSPRFHA